MKNNSSQFYFLHFLADLLSGNAVFLLLWINRSLRWVQPVQSTVYSLLWKLQPSDCLCPVSLINGWRSLETSSSLEDTGTLSYGKVLRVKIVNLCFTKISQEKKRQCGGRVHNCPPRSGLSVPHQGAEQTAFSNSPPSLSSSSSTCFLWLSEFKDFSLLNMKKFRIKF